jgi:hypothetical protein
MPDDFAAFARERSHQDVKTSSEYGKLLIQFVAGANGLSITALLTLAGAQHSPGMARALVLPLLVYSAGVISGLAAARYYYQAARAFATRWEWESYKKTTVDAEQFWEEKSPPARAKQYLDEGLRELAAGDRWVTRGIGAFVCGGIIAMMVLAWS